MDLKAEVFVPVANRVRDRADSLQGWQRFKRSGIEGWLKVEVIAALGDLVEKVQNNGPDLLLPGGVLVELKAATDLNTNDLQKEFRRHGRVPLLLLGSGSDPAKIAKLATDDVELVIYEVFADPGGDHWVVALLATPGEV